MSEYLKYRADIDGLRAIAVISVILYHAFPSSLPGGFTGVDVFFVISGYLISGILLREFENKNFNYRKFYEKRVRRIFPSLIVVMCMTLICGWFLLLQKEYRQLAKHIISGAFFSSNFILLNESGYFDKSSEYKPLLHLWSLGIEEQFYIFWPIILQISYRLKKNVFKILVITLFASLFLSCFLTPRNSTIAFYLPFTRAWELFLGAVLAFIVTNESHSKIKLFLYSKRNYLTMLGLVSIFISFFVLSKDKNFPGLWAALPSVGALLIIASGKDSIVGNILSLKIFRGIGLISYPLYLWHWPSISFLYILNLQEDVILMTSALALSFILSIATYFFVEKPLRFNKSKSTFKYLCFLMILLVLLSALILIFRGFPKRKINKVNLKVSSSLGYRFKRSVNCPEVYKDEPEGFFCFSTGNKPTVMLLGDSHANQLIGGLSKSLVDVPMISAGNGAPLVDVEIGFKKSNSHPWVKNLKSLKKNLAFIDRNPQLKVIVLAAQWDALVNGGFINRIDDQEYGGIILNPKNNNKKELSNEKIVLDSLKKLIQSLLKRKKTLILVTDPPEILDDIRNCRYYLDGSISCHKKIRKEVILARKKGFNRVLTSLKSEFPQLVIFETSKYFCDSSDCYYFNNDSYPFYRDTSHLSNLGVSLFADDLGKVIKDLL